MNRKPHRLLSLLLALAMVLSLLPAALAAPELPEITLPNGDFELGNSDNWVVSGLPADAIRTDEWNDANPSWTLNLWASDTDEVEIHASYPVKLSAGTYQFTFLIGGDGKDSNLKWTVKAGEEILAEQEGTVTTTGWGNWATVETTPFTLTEDTDIVFDFGGTGPAGYWGDLDDLKLYGDGEIVLPELALPNGDFETGDTANWTVSGLPADAVRNNEWNEPNTSWTLNLWASDTDPVEIHASYPVTLTAGTYRFSFLISGMAGDSNLKWTVKAGEEVLAEQEGTVTTVDWNVWETVTTDKFTLTEETEVTFDFGGTGPAGYWGDLDDLKLYGDGEAVFAPAHIPEIYVPKVEGIDGDFMRGTDVSSFLSIYNSGATFYDFEGNALDQQGFFDLLAESGYNYVRLRLWNDPFDAEGNGYGGGNCDINAVLAMGQWATKAGLRVLVDFHYSDFWADPGKQKTPKAWVGMTIDEKTAALQTFTYDCLKTLLDGGVDVGMVQIGNETTGSICGESNWANKAKLFSAGSAATRQISEEFEHPILVSIHFTNPERSGNYASQARNLNNYGVDYDIFASSWYPFWHGTLENLTTVLKDVADTYGKQVVVTETSWAYTLADGDGHDNTVRTGNNDGNYGFEFSVQGQADELVAVTEAVKNVGDAGMGVFYWENAWIPVEYAYDEEGNLVEDILTSNKAKWEEFGSGWAASYASEYDPNDAGVWFGGSACDNQAQFDFNGHPLDSLMTWSYMLSGAADTIELEVLDIEEPALVYAIGDTLAMPETVNVTYNVGGTEKVAVVWDEEAVAKVDMNTPGVYRVKGVVTTECGDFDVVCKITVNYPNLLKNPGFEESDMSMYTLNGMRRRTDNPLNGRYGLGFYNGNAVNVSATQTVELEPGDYTFSLNAMGGSMGDNQNNYAFVRIPDAEGETELTDSFVLTAWNDWKLPTINFTLEETTTVTVGVQITGAGGGWGDTDDWNLCKTLDDPIPGLLEEVAALNPLDYTGASWAALEAAVEAAETGEGTAELLRYAIDNLEEKSTEMALGSDISAAARGDRSYNDQNGESRKLYDIITNDYGYNMVRLRTWTGNDDGSCGKNTIIAYAKLCADAGLRIMIDFHYADSWADPGKQPPPAAWGVTNDVSAAEADRVAGLLYDYTYDWISSLVEAGVYPEWVQVGNEINGGMVWPLGHTTNMENFIKLLQAGTAAVRDASPTTKIIIHRSSAEETDNVLGFYQSLIDNGYTDFDVIGLSFYPYDMDPTYLLECVSNTFDGLYEQFCKDTHREIMLVEIGSNYMEGNGATYNQGYNMIVNCIRKLQAIPDGKGTGCMYWEIENYEYTGSGSNRRPTVVWNAFTPGAELINEVPVTGLALSATELELQVNNAESLSVTYTPAKPDITELTWTSSDPAVATVNGAGLVLAIGVGEADITITSTATADGTPVTATCHVTVIPEIPGLKNGGFELGDQYWVIDEEIVGNAKISSSDNHLNGSYSLHYAAVSTGLDIGFSQLVKGLEAGTYTLTCRVMGDSRESTGYIFAGDLQSAPFQTTGWTSNESGWITVTLENIVVEEGGDLLVGAKVTSTSSGAWGDFDDFALVKNEVTVDTAALEEAIAAAEAVNTEDYTEETVTALEEALAAAKAVLEDTEATQEQVDAALEALNTAVAGLVEKCKHEETEIRNAKDPTCTEPGYTGDTYCTVCGEKIAEGEEIAALGHGETEIRDHKDPTCTEPGYTGDTYCTVCGEKIAEGEEIAALGHGETETRDHKDPTCTEPGYTGDTYCTVCGEKIAEGEEIAALGHDYEDGVCTVCGEEDPDYLPENPFIDVEEDDYFYTPVLWAVKKGITTGTTPTTFSPDEDCTRGQVVTFLWRANGCPEPTTTENPFTDVPENMYYYKAVLWAVEEGITTGTSATEFEPEEPCTRGQVATFLWRAHGKPAPEGKSEGFTDVPENMYYYEAILWAAENGITNGVGNGEFEPDESCTRAQIVTFIYRAMAK